jgi:hypothetical protein
MLKTTSMAGPLGALSAGPTASTTDVEDDVDGGPLGGRCRWVRQRPPLWLKKASMVGPLRALPVGLMACTTEVEDDMVSIPPCVQILIGSCKVKHEKQ